MFIFVCVCDLDRDKISIRYFRFLPGFRKYCVFVMVARQKMSPKSSFWKTHPPLPEDFLGRWGVWCYEGSGMSPSKEDIGSLSDFPSFRDEAQLDRCSQKWSKFEKIFWWRKFSWPREMKNPWFPQIHDFRKYRKVIIFISVRSRRKIRARVSWAFSRAMFPCPVRFQRNQTSHRLKKSDGKVVEYIHEYIYSVFEKWF